jgi:DNA invertase Pin-like site-specific DNA recombinase
VTQAKVQRVGVYLRVSTMDQEAQNQLLQLQALYDQNGWAIYRKYVDVESGRKGKRERAEFAELFRDAAKHRFDLVLFWSLDRFQGRASPRPSRTCNSSTAAGSSSSRSPSPF